MGWGETREFLSKVVAWPGDEPGFVNLHYSMPNRDGGKDIVTGKPFTDIDQFLGFAGWALKADNIKEQWYCTSQQAIAGTTQNGKPKAIRLHQNARLLKAIWIDIDVKDDSKNYSSLQEAWAAFTAFRTTVHLPEPSGVVKSGGGLHIYWISEAPLTPEEWTPYAQGLKTLLIKHGVRCDAGLTTDDVRLLRVPSTLNYKYDPPRPVELLPIPLVEYDFASSLRVLAEAAPAAAKPLESSLPASFIGKKPVFALTAGDRLSDGIEQEERLLPFEPIVKGCAFIREALRTGGKDYSQPMWNLSTLAATFMENGNALAHKMAAGHQGYDRGDTERLYARKLRERSDRGLGWPSCAAIQANGCGSCTGCPHFAAGKSPLNLAIGNTARKPAGSTNSARAGNRALVGGSELPDGYIHDSSGYICKIVETKNGESTPRLFLSRLDMFWAQKDENHDYLHFRTSYDKGNFRAGFVTLADMSSGQLASAFAKPTARVKINPDSKKYLEGFCVSLLSKLHDAMEAQETQPFGWVEEGGAKKGFVYGGRLFKTDGTDIAAGATDPRLMKWYQPTGELQPWLEAARTITSIGRPDLNTLLVASFASPLVLLTGQEGVTVAAWGDSGASKTAAMKVGQAVWSVWNKTKEGKTTTEKSLYNKMGATRHLPVYWDEITDDKSIARAVEVSFAQTGGGEGGRLTVNVEQRDRGTWQCMLVTSANVSLIDEVVKKHPSHRGGINRVFEYEMKAHDKRIHRLMSTTEADRIIAKVMSNHGIIGLEYAKYLATHAAEIDAEVAAVRARVEKELEATSEERFWTVAVATLILGAKYANILGLDVDEPALEKFLYTTFRANRDRGEAEAVVGGSKENTDALLSAYLKERAALQTIWTDGLRASGGKAMTTLLRAPERSSNVREGIMVRWDVPSRMLVISRGDFGKWLAARHVSPTPVVRGLVRNYGAEWPLPKKVLASGTTFKALPETLIRIKVAPETDLWEILMTYSGDTPIAEAAE